MNQLVHYLSHLFDTSDFPPRWNCGVWTPFDGWFYIASDLAIWIAYMSIPLWLMIFITRRKDVPFHGIFWLFIAFIFLCGSTHLIDALAFWWPAYRFNALVRFLTAAVSLATVAALIPILPQAFALRSPQALERELLERERTEEELRKTTAQLEEHTIQLQSVNKELEAFSYSVSHDLRAPLRSLDGYSQALLEDYGDRLDDEGRHYLERIRASSQNMAHLIDDLLQLSRTTRMELQPSEVDLSRIAEEITRELHQSHPDRTVDVTIEPGLTAFGDRRLLTVLLQNLLENAWKFTSGRDPARIEFGRTRQHGKPAFFIRDNGTGFDMTYKDKLFGAFQRLHGAEFPGSGIGLATVSRVLSRHGGTIWADGKPDEGATFYFSLPSAFSEEVSDSGTAHPVA